MSSFDYVAALSPPAPFAIVNLMSVDGQTVVADRNAQLDSAADRTAVPEAFIVWLGAEAIEQREFAGFDGSRSTLSIYRILLTIHGVKTPFLVDVIGSAHEPWVLLGRDILNQLRSVMDGPRQKLEIN